MLCLTCKEREVIPPQRDCRECKRKIHALIPEVMDSLRDMVRPTATPTPAETSVKRIESVWSPVEISDMIARRMRWNAVNDALLCVPGISQCPERYIRGAGVWLGCRVVPGTEQDTILVTGYEPRRP